jgi:putative glycerol-1-phosphate prenyltransferase
MNCYNLISSPGKKLALLIDPDNMTVPAIISTVYEANESGVKIIFVGGSLLSTSIDNTIEVIKKHTDIPVILFPGSYIQLSNKADALLLLSLVSGRNADYLIGNHVFAAPYIKKSGLEVIPTGYILIDGGRTSSVEYVSNTKPIPADKTELVVATAIASEMLGQKLIYLEAGSGANCHVPVEVIREVKKNISLPLIVGGGIKSAVEADNLLKAGADIIVIGTIIEQDIDNLQKIVAILRG